ncbi:MAG: RluA family pseudouridine synthase [Pseudomonadota bacterium]
MHDGVSASSVVTPAGEWKTVLEFLAARFSEISLEDWHSRMQRGRVLDEAGQPLQPGSAFAAGVRIRYFRELETEVEIPFEAQILFQDEHLLVADKPHFLPVMPSGRFLQQTLLVRLKKLTGLDQLTPLHRIDRGTAGVVLLSVNPATRAAYQKLFATRQMHKVYEALAPHLDLEFPLTRRSRLVKGEPFFRMREAVGNANTETQIEIAERRGDLSLYRLRPVTGKQHQLRVHMAALGAAIVNDPLYPELKNEADDDFSHPLKLLARSIAFTDPVTGQPREFSSRRML